jgi:acetylornithine/succinyldiaminopimelate/putrescine aminotransferase
VPRGLDLVRLRAAARFGFGGPVVGAGGVYLRGPDGEKYLDAAGGATVPLGHRHPAVLAAVRDALDGPGAGSPLLADADRLGLAERVVALSPGGLAPLGVFSGGRAALDAALSLARALTGRQAVVEAGGGVPGDEAIGWTAARLEPRLEGAAAVVVEPVPAATFALAAEGELGRLRAVADRCGTLIVADERGLGIGRCGALVAAGTLGLEADLVVVNGLGGGVMPAALLLGRARVAAAVEAGKAGTFAPVVEEGWAGPLACAAATATLDVLVEEAWPARAAEAGRAFGRALSALEAAAPDGLVEVRGVGLAWAIECAGPEVAEGLVRSLALDRILVAPPPPGGRVVWLLPPLVVESRELDFVASSVDRVLEDL